MRAAACLVAVSLIALPGCIVVVDHDGESHWSHEESTHARHIGVYLSTVDETTASQLGLDASRSTAIARVFAGSPADRAGLKAHDIITAVDGDSGATQGRIHEAIRSRQPGETVTLDILRQGKPQTIQVCVK